MTTEEYEVEAVLDSMELTSDMIVYLVKWKNYDPEYNTWEPVENLGNCSKLLVEFLKNGPDVQRTEFEKMKSLLMQHTKEEADKVLDKFRNKKGEWNEVGKYFNDNIPFVKCVHVFEGQIYVSHHM